MLFHHPASLNTSLAFRTLGDPRQRRQVSQVLLDRTRRRSPEHDSLASNHFLAGNTTLGAQNGACLDPHVIGNSNLPADDHLVLDHGAAGDPGLCSDHDILTNVDVVSHMHEVINFRSAADASYVQGATIYGRVRADLDVIFDLQASNLGEFFVSAGL